MATIKEIADRANVSSSTVSRVLNHDVSINVSDSTKLKIFNIADELNYKVPKNRKGNFEKETKPNFLILDWLSEKELLDDPFYLFMMTSVEKYCAKNEINYFKSIKVDDNYFLSSDAKIDGVIAIGRFSDDGIKALTAFSKNIVFIDSSPKERIYDSVVINYRIGIRDALRYFIKMGHRSIGYVGGVNRTNKNSMMEDLRFIYFKEYLEEKKIYNEKYVYIGNSISFGEGESIGTKIAKTDDKPTAIFAASDTVANGVLNGFSNNNISVPEDISLIGFNDLPTTKYLKPSLTSIKVQMDYMSKTAVDILLQRISGAYNFPRKISVPCNLVIRDSVKKYIHK